MRFLSRKSIFIHLCLFLVWAVVHTPILQYATDNLPLHTAYIGDEQSPIYGGLHILEERSIMAVRNLDVLYYGPMFAVLAVPAIGADATSFFLNSGTVSVGAYQNHVLYDWGGIAFWARVISLLVSYLGLAGVFALLRTKVVNPSRSPWLPWLGVVLVATNFYFFSYGAVFRHWIYLITPFIWQVYFLARLLEGEALRCRWLLWQAVLGAFAFAFSYVGLLTQALLIPLCLRTMFSWRNLLQWLLYFGAPFVGLCTLIIAWHPYAFFRILAFFTDRVIDSTVADIPDATPPSAVNGLQYYTEILLVNHVVLILSLALLLLIFYKKLLPQVRTLLVSVTLVGIVYFILFSSFEIVVSRYALMPIIALHLLFLITASSLWGTLSKIIKKLLFVVVVLQVLFHITTIGWWNADLAAGPVEREYVSNLLELTKDQTTTVYVLGGHAVGWPHTTSSLTQLASVTNRTDFGLYQAYTNSQSPRVDLLDVRYLSEDEVASGMLVFSCTDPTADGGKFVDYPEVRLYRFWQREAWWHESCELNVVEE